MRSHAIVDPKLRGTYFSDYLSTLGKQESNFFEFSLEVLPFIERVEDWCLTNWDDLPERFVRENDETKEVYIRAHLPYTEHQSCPRDPSHTSTRLDEHGRTVCAHCTSVVVPLDHLEVLAESYDRDSAKVRNKFRIRSTPSPFSEGYDQYVKSLAQTSQALVVERCDAVISDRESRLPLEYVIRRVNAERNRTKAFYEKRTPSGKEYRNEFYTPTDEIPKELDGGFSLVKSQELLSFSYNPVHIASLVKKWWMQEPQGTAPVYRG